MAASVRKRDIKLEDDNFSVPCKTSKFNNDDDKKLSSFLSWCTSEGVSISNKVNRFLYWVNRRRRGVVNANELFQNRKWLRARTRAPWRCTHASQTAAIAAVAGDGRYRGRRRSMYARKPDQSYNIKAIKSDLPRMTTPFHCADLCNINQTNIGIQRTHLYLSLIHIWRCRRIERCRSRWSPYH